MGRNVVMLVLLIIGNVLSAETIDFYNFAGAADVYGVSVEVMSLLPDEKYGGYSSSAGVKKSSKKPALIRAKGYAGTGIFFAGLGLEYAVGLPLTINAIANNDVHMVSGIMATGIASTIMQASGVTLNGIAASNAFDYSLNIGTDVVKNTNWDFYRAGWGFSAAAAVLDFAYTTNFFRIQQLFGPALPVIAMGSSLCADIMWIIAVVKGTAYVRRYAKTPASGLRLSVQPVFGMGGNSTGIVAQLTLHK